MVALEDRYVLRSFEGGNPYRVLIRTILSQRTRDENTDQASALLFSKYKNVHEVAQADVEDIEELVFFTAGPVYSKSRGYMSTSDSTYNSVTERSDEYDVVAIYKVGDARVIAFGDMSWLIEPYVNAADNYQLLRNLVEVIVSPE